MLEKHDYNRANEYAITNRDQMNMGFPMEWRVFKKKKRQDIYDYELDLRAPVDDGIYNVQIENDEVFGRGIVVRNGKFVLVPTLHTIWNLHRQQLRGRNKHNRDDWDRAIEVYEGTMRGVFSITWNKERNLFLVNT